EPGTDHDDPPARRVTSDAPALTAAGAVMGTPAYMAPEQALGEPVDERVDVYALGVLLYQLASGALPFEGRTSAEIMARVIGGAGARRRGGARRGPAMGRGRPGGPRRARAIAPSAPAPRRWRAPTTRGSRAPACRSPTIRGARWPSWRSCRPARRAGRRPA